MNTFQTEIIERCKSNDRQAQLKLYQQYCDGMYVVAFRFVKNSMEAEDLVQEAFIKAFAKMDQFRAEVSFGAWLKRIVVHKSIDLLKSKKQHTQELEEVHLKIIDEPYDNEWLVDDGIGLEQVIEAITQLPDKYRFVVTLYLVEGYDHQEISEILNITEVASRTQLSRGKSKLKTLLKPIYDGKRS